MAALTIILLLLFAPFTWANSVFPDEGRIIMSLETELPNLDSSLSSDTTSARILRMTNEGLSGMIDGVELFLRLRKAGIKRRPPSRSICARMPSGQMATPFRLTTLFMLRAAWSILRPEQRARSFWWKSKCRGDHRWQDATGINGVSRNRRSNVAG